jgi:L,D-transpeptidase ErfK/SrfK
MREPFRKGLIVSAYALWFVAFAVGVYRTTTSYVTFQNAVRHTEELSKGLTQESQKIMDAARLAKISEADTTFLRSLVALMPENKSFIRTQRAMSDEVETLRYKVGRRIKKDLHILVDTRANKLYVKQGLLLLWEADCSVGRGGILLDKSTGRRWEFATPRGQFEIRDKIENPLWTKPDWAFVEENKPVPPPGDPIRKVAGELGNYVMNLGDGYLIHGTRNEAALGRPVSHGCVRLGAENLQRLFEAAPPRTKVFIY